MPNIKILNIFLFWLKLNYNNLVFKKSPVEDLADFAIFSGVPSARM